MGRRDCSCRRHNVKCHVLATIAMRIDAEAWEGLASFRGLSTACS